MRAVLLCVLFSVSVSSGWAQNSVAPMCGNPPAMLRSTQPNIFSEQQEQWLGEAEADMIEHEYRPLKDEKQNAYLELIGKRLLAVLPPTQLQFRFQLIDSPEVNGFSLAGGRVYVTRKLVANAQSEDELAGVIAHELGHILTHQFAYEVTADMKRLLGVTSVGDRADVYAKFQKLVDAYMRDKHTRRGDTDEKQDEADRVSVYANAAAGYRPQAFAEFWDRSFFVGGKTGTGLSDFFGLTKPNEKRLRLIQKMAADFPASCTPGTPEPARKLAFQKWHDEVVANQATAVVAATRSLSPGGAAEVKPAAEVQLSPPLRLDFDRVRFSPDGKYILAQDESSIFVVAREPLKPLFRFDAENALAADFTPDSEQIVFHTPSLRVERWSIAEQKQVAAHELNVKHDCLQTRLVPDGRTLACIYFTAATFTIDMALLDVETSNTLFEKKGWFEPSNAFIYSWNLHDRYGTAPIEISSSVSEDGNSLIIGPGKEKLAFDLRTRTPIKLGGTLKGSVRDYVFQGSDKVLGSNFYDLNSSGIFSFPDGRQLQKFPFSPPAMAPVTHGNFILINPGKDFEMGIADPVTKKFIALSKLSSMDLWGDTIATENSDGTLLVYKVGTTDPNLAHRASLPLGPLSGTRAAAISPDGRYLTLSAIHRSGIWDLVSGKQSYLTRGIVGAEYASDGRLLLELPKVGDFTHHIVEANPATRDFKDLPYKIEDAEHLECGRLLEWKLDKKIFSLIAHSPNDNSVQWTRSFGEERPGQTTNVTDDDLIFSYSTQSALGKDKLHDAALKDEAAKVKFKDAGRVVEIADSATGTARMQVVVEVPVSYEGANGFNRVGDLLYLNVGDNRSIVYSMTTGAQVRQIFGFVIAADPVSQRVAAINRRDELIVYDSGGAELEHLKLGSVVRFAALRNKGTQLTVLTADQKVRRFDVAAGSAK